MLLEEAGTNLPVIYHKYFSKTSDICNTGWKRGHGGYTDVKGAPPWRFCVRTDHGGECSPEIPDFMMEGDGVQNENPKQLLSDGITDAKKRDKTGESHEGTEYDAHERQFSFHDVKQPEHQGKGDR